MTQEQATPPGFWERVQQMIDRAVAASGRSGPLRNATISGGGGLTVKGGALKVRFPDTLGGGLGVYFGDLLETGTGTYLGTGLLIQDADGQDIAQIRTDDATGKSVVVLNDAQGHNVLTTYGTDIGMSRPYLQGGFVPARYADWTVTSTSATFETLWRGNLWKQNPAIFVRTRASMDTAGETGEVRVMVDGVQLGSTMSVGFGLTTLDFGPEDVTGEHMEFLDVEIQGRRVSAAGSLRVAPGVWIGRGL